MGVRCRPLLEAGNLAVLSLIALIVFITVFCTISRFRRLLYTAYVEFGYVGLPEAFDGHSSLSMKPALSHSDGGLGLCVCVRACISG